MTERRGKYCVVCRRYYGPHLSKCCSPTSLVDTIKVGWLGKTIKFIDHDGNALDRTVIQKLAKAEREKATAKPESQNSYGFCCHRNEHQSSSSAQPGDKEYAERTRMSPKESAELRFQESDTAGAKVGDEAETTKVSPESDPNSGIPNESFRMRFFGQLMGVIVLLLLGLITASMSYAGVSCSPKTMPGEVREYPIIGVEF
jgi:hypothetical protein